MTALARRYPGYRSASPARAAFVGLVVFVHVALLRLMVEAGARPWRVDPPSVPTIATWNILASDDAPPARATPDAKALPIQVNIDAPTVEVEEPAPIAAGLGAALPIDPYAGAAPVRAGTVPLPSFPIPAVKPATHDTPGPAGDSPFARWVADLRVRLAPTLAGQPATFKPVRAEVFAQPDGGFTTARIAHGSGDLTIDRAVLVDLMHHQELVERGVVAAPRWFTLPAIDLVPA